MKERFIERLLAETFCPNLIGAKAFELLYSAQNIKDFRDFKNNSGMFYTLELNS